MISVIIPVYNASKYIARCILSVKGQFFTDWECIIVDDGSTDGGQELIHELTNGDKRFTVISKENGGVSSARNAGIELAKGDLFFLDADDWIERNAIMELMVAAGIHSKAGRIVSPAMTHHSKHGWVIPWSITPAGMHGPNSPFLFSGPDCDPGHVTGSLYIRDRIPCQLQFPKVKMFEDMIFNMGLMFCGVSTFISKTYLYHYTRNEGSLISQPLNQEEAKAAMEALDTLAERFDAQPETYERCRRFLNNAINGKTNE